MSFHTGPRGLFRSRSSVEFVHSQKSANLGDKLCTPKHYFTFQPSRSAGKIAIIGGGSWTSLGVEFASTSKADHKILWGVGRSLRPNRPASEIDFAAIGQLFGHASTRDPEWAINGLLLVPCVSVFHPLCDIAPGDRTGLLFNASKAGGQALMHMLRERSERFGELVIGTNWIPEKDFSRLFSETRRIITNSYHVAYWGLLSGRAITVLGYSSKFASLMTLVGHPSDCVIPYQKRDQASLIQAAEQALREPARVRLENAEALKNRFRVMNLNFASRLVQSGLFDSITRAGV